MLVSTSSRMLRALLSNWGSGAVAPLGQALGPRMPFFWEASLQQSVLPPLSRRAWTGQQRSLGQIPDSLKAIFARHSSSSSWPRPGTAACHALSSAAGIRAAALPRVLQHGPLPPRLRLGRVLAQGAAAYCFIKVARLPVAMAQGSSKTVWSFIPGSQVPASSPEDDMEADAMAKNAEDVLSNFLKILQRLWIPLCTAVVLYLAQTDIIAGAISIVGVMISTCPSLESLYAWMAEKRRRPKSTIADYVDDVATQVLGLAQLEYHDCYLFAVARIRRRLLLGVFGQWWELDSVWPFSLLNQ